LSGLIYRAAGVDPGKEMDWKAYALAMLAFHLVGFLAVYLLQRFQGLLPLNPTARRRGAHLGVQTPPSRS